VTHWRASFEGNRPAHGPFLRISTRWWVIRLGAWSSSPNPRPKLLRWHSHAHFVCTQMIEIPTKLGTTGPKPLAAQFFGGLDFEKIIHESSAPSTSRIYSVLMV
jgi:hypothetical protein